MASTGIDRETGLPLAGFAHVVQCVGVIFNTREGEMIMLRWFCAGLIELLGKRATEENLARYRLLLAVAIATWEPRLSVVAVRTSGNTTANAALGHFVFEVQCHYRPNALVGDFTVEGGLRRIGIGASNDNLAVTVRALAA